MRTTVRLDERLLQQAKAFAARERRTLTAVIDDALRQFLSRSVPRHPKRPAVQLITFRGAGPRAGIDLDDTAGLVDVMEEHERREQQR